MEIINIPLPKGNNFNNPKRIVIHAMGEFIYRPDRRSYVHAYESLRIDGLSAHRLVTPTGQMIKLREDQQGAYHALGHNTDTLGIEFLVSGAHDYESFSRAIKSDWLTAKQLENGAYIVRSWMDKWDIGIENVVGHNEIDPSRKEDPGEGFPWREFKWLIK